MDRVHQEMETIQHLKGTKDTHRETGTASKHHHIDFAMLCPTAGSGGQGIIPNSLTLQAK